MEIIHENIKQIECGSDVKHRIKNYSFQIFIVFICIQLGMSQVNASGFIRLYDATVTGQNVSLNNSSNNQK